MPRFLTGALTAGVLILAGCAADTTAPSAQPADAPATTTTAAPVSGGAMPVVASTDIYGDILARIGGDRVAVTSIIQSASAADPHSYEASSRDQLVVSQARLVVVNGGGYDEFMTRLIAASGTDSRVLDVVEIAQADHGAAEDAAPTAMAPADSGGHDHSGEGNEHVWYDLAAMDALAAQIASTLSELDPGGAPQFDAGAATFQSAIAALATRVEGIKSAHSGTAVAVTEPLASLLLADAGLVDKTPAEFSEGIEEGNGVPVRVFQEMLTLVSSGEIEALIYNVQTTNTQPNQVRDAAEEAGIPTVTVLETLPEGTDYLTLLDLVIRALEEALTL